MTRLKYADQTVRPDLSVYCSHKTFVCDLSVIPEGRISLLSFNYHFTSHTVHFMCDALVKTSACLSYDDCYQTEPNGRHPWTLLLSAFRQLWILEPLLEKTNVLHMRKQRRRSAAR